MLDRKYIVVKTKDTGEELMIQFPKSINHNDMWEAVQSMRCNSHGRNWHRPFINDTVVSAGFISPMGTCHGKSESLNVASRPKEDTAIATK